MSKFESKLRSVTGLGSAKDGFKTWLSQRVSAVFIIPLLIWCIMAVIATLKSADYEFILHLIKPATGAVLLVAFISISLYHGMLGIHEIIEDYVKCRTVKMCSIIGLKMFTFITWLFAIFAIAAFHFSTYAT
jgi:succinate dehydrogenase / fumarate reductase membrane anchor subunit